MARPIYTILVQHWMTDRPDKVTMADIDAIYRGFGAMRTPYHYLVHENGKIEKGRNLDLPAMIDPAFDRNAIGVGCVMEWDKGYSPDSKRVLEELITKLLVEHPGADVEVNFGKPQTR